jgi:Icc-related predicted phosphoesterase
MRAMLRRLWLRLRLAGGVDIVLTHAPPRHIGDCEDRCHKGFVCYRRLIEKYAPAWFIHGHIHADFTTIGERITLYRTTRVVNCYGYVLLEL